MVDVNKWVATQEVLWVRRVSNCIKFLVRGRDLACQQEVSLALMKTPPIHYYNVVDSVFSNYTGQLRI